MKDLVWFLRHFAFIGIAILAQQWIAVQFMSEMKEIPFIPQNLCERTYYTSDTAWDPSYDLNKKGKIEFNPNERTTYFEQYVSKESYESKKLPKAHWAYGHYKGCIENVNEYLIKEGITENLKKKGRFPPSCFEYSKCGGGLLIEEDEWDITEFKSKEGNSFSLSSSSGYQNYKIRLHEVRESGGDNMLLGLFIFLLFYLPLIFGWRFLVKKLDEI